MENPTFNLECQAGNLDSCNVRLGIRHCFIGLAFKEKLNG